MTATRHVVLLGLMASGKSTVGRLLAARIDRPFVDNDDALGAQTGRSARAIAASDGPDALHRREAEVLIAALADPVPAVIAAAAAAPLEPGAAPALAPHERVYLRCAPDVLAARLARQPDDGHRPFLTADIPKEIAAQFAARDGRYRALATLVVDAAADAPAVVDEVISALGPGALGPRTPRTRPGS